MTETTALRGIFPIVYTPFDDDSRIDAEDLERLVEHLIAAGAHGLAAVGGASECHTLPVAERMWLAERTMHHARGRAPVFVGTAATNTADAITLRDHAQAIGATVQANRGDARLPAVCAYPRPACPALASPFCRSSAVITGANVTSASSSWKKGSAIAGICDRSVRSKTMNPPRFPAIVAK